ncbi:MAG: purine phosphorylase family 1 [Candidatus Magnetoglobus multicellularis str. Araruama]|uniref:Futalosine hydrolase n=1 Tax=Candidatus Magnetoglobus multicellularis str. Araruama TaxID=890399 RepID=A0A1V1PII5_9BACT|nr:MAG: purine phosphorylase family 1 [Candidatus Magnetoglobus multicellularis str. Araruama]
MIADDGSILIIAAVSHEIKPVMDRLNNPQKRIIGGRNVLCGKLFNHSVIAVVSGIGMLNAAQAATSVIEKMPVHLVINTGCAGAFSEKGFTIGDIGIATQETDIHSGVEPIPPDRLIKQLPFPVIQNETCQSFGAYPTSEKYSKLAYDILCQQYLFNSVQVKQVPFITVSTITASEDRRKNLYRYYQAGMENMEGAGIAHIAAHYCLPFMEIRSASNFVGDRNKANWQLALAFERSTNAILLVLRLI